MAPEERTQQDEKHHIRDHLNGEELRTSLQLRQRDEGKEQREEQHEIARLLEEGLAEEEDIDAEDREEQEQIEEEPDVDDRGGIPAEAIDLLDVVRAQDIIDMWRDDLPTVDDTLALLHHPRRGREAG